MLVRRFLDKTLPIEEWNHEAHVIVALWHLINFSQAEATHILRCRIIEYNAMQGTGNSFASGYHETVTQLWIWLLSNFIDQYPNDVSHTIQAFLSTDLATGQWISDLYSAETLASDQARALWVDPDLHPLNFAYLSNKYISL